MIRKLCLAVAVSAVSALGVGVAGASAAPIQLTLAAADADSLLALVCTPVAEQTYATGFDPITAQPEGDAYVSSTCTSSGRGGHSVLYSAWASVVWNFDGTTSSFGPLASAPSTNENIDVFDSLGDELFNSGPQAYLKVIVPASPTGVTDIRSGGQYLVSWLPDPTVPASLITSSTITATPVASSSPTISTTVDGQATSGLLGPLNPSTTYDVTVVSSNASGSTMPSAPVMLTTGKSVLRPGVPMGVGVSGITVGTSTNAFTVGWSASSYGDSPTDKYEALIVGTDGGGIHTATVSGTALSTTFTVTSAAATWYILVRAHDAAGWSAWSHALTLSLD